MRCFGYVSMGICLLLASCSTTYHFPKKSEMKQETMGFVWQPGFQRTLYRCEANGRFLFKKFHLSGLLYFRNFSDTATRVVFQNELGITYFDFGWDKHNDFHVYHIMEQMNKPALITTLQKDFEIFLGKNIDNNALAFTTAKPKGKWIRHSFYDGFVYYFFPDNGTDSCTQIDYGTSKKVLTRFSFTPPIKTEKTPLPDSIVIKHFRAGFSILLKRLPHDEQN